MLGLDSAVMEGTKNPKGEMMRQSRNYQQQKAIRLEGQEEGVLQMEPVFESQRNSHCLRYLWRWGGAETLVSPFLHPTIQRGLNPADREPGTLLL